ncbi:isoprenylcysteine carboxyl methyltransferase family protein [Anaerobacillus sp. CMMVII]|uniref:isoprenylcysteine carboxyl methyltransferase family protein n=1 Tax=Anaerobacillus sp. CMMVII TaxID=2755588 RepID=UPI0021B84459|nr:isoprenylcysteine carboxyl methyltransferase family protein [Anaerobacillus sp. CMMVII]MCT8137168.1 isoprenylcysteine carboxyl methyltransferase family protein [Anaerobacillus sp. CMMVII]
MIGFYIFIFFVISQRIIELFIAKRNAIWIIKKGGYEVGREHYKFIVILHALFFISLLTEVTLNKPSFANWVIIPFIIFLFAQFGRVWALTSLGPFWNTRIMVLPGAKVIAKGPYRFMRHPNYFIVITEIALLPLIFQAYWTALIFTLCNALILSVRIKAEEQALQEATDYQDVFKKRGRFVPSYEK